MAEDYEPKIYETTKRNIITKLEIPSIEPKYQLNLVSKKVFNLENIPKRKKKEKKNVLNKEQQEEEEEESKEEEINEIQEIFYSKDSNNWIATDEIYNKARNSYQEIISPFTEIPKVYKIEGIKEKMFQYRLNSLNKEEVRKREPLRGKGINKYLNYKQKNNEPEYLEDIEGFFSSFSLLLTLLLCLFVLITHHCLLAFPP